MHFVPISEAYAFVHFYQGQVDNLSEDTEDCSDQEKYALGFIGAACLLLILYLEDLA